MRALLLLFLAALGACGGKHALRVDCEGELVPINVRPANGSDRAADLKRAEER